MQNLRDQSMMRIGLIYLSRIDDEQWHTTEENIDFKTVWIQQVNGQFFNFFIVLIRFYIYLDASQQR